MSPFSVRFVLTQCFLILLTPQVNIGLELGLAIGFGILYIFRVFNPLMSNAPWNWEPPNMLCALMHPGWGQSLYWLIVKNIRF